MRPCLRLLLIAALLIPISVDAGTTKQALGAIEFEYDEDVIRTYLDPGETFEVGRYRFDTGIHSRWQDEGWHYKHDTSGLTFVAFGEEFFVPYDPYRVRPEFLHNAFNCPFYQAGCANIAPGAAAFASATARPDKRSPTTAINGNESDDWVSLGESPTKPSYLMVDLGSERAISKVRIKRAPRERSPDRRLPADFELQVSSQSCRGTDWSSGEIYRQTVTDNALNDWTGFYAPAVSGRCVRVEISSSYGNKHYPNVCSGKPATQCSAAIDELEIYETPGYYLRYQGEPYLPVAIQNSAGKVVGHLILNSAGEVVTEYSTLWAIYNLIAVLGGETRTGYDLEGDARYFDYLAEQRRLDAEDLQDFAEIYGIAERVALDFTAVVLSTSSGDLFGAALSALNTPMLLTQMWAISNEDVSLEDWMGKGSTAKSLPELAMAAKDLKPILDETVALLKAKRQSTNTSFAANFFSNWEQYKITQQMKGQALKVAPSAVVNLMGAVKRDTAIDALKASMQYYQSALAYQKMAQILRAAADGIDTAAELEDVAYLGLLAAYAANTDAILTGFMVDTYDAYLKEDWRGWIYRLLDRTNALALGNTASIDEVRTAGQTMVGKHNTNSDYFRKGFHFDYALATAEAARTIARVQPMEPQPQLTNLNLAWAGEADATGVRYPENLTGAPDLNIAGMDVMDVEEARIVFSDFGTGTAVDANALAKVLGMSLMQLAAADVIAIECNGSRGAPFESSHWTVTDGSARYQSNPYQFSHSFENPSANPSLVHRTNLTVRQYRDFFSIQGGRGCGGDLSVMLLGLPDDMDLDSSSFTLTLSRGEGDAGTPDPDAIGLLRWRIQVEDDLSTAF